jgi:hypothetical protein
MDCSVLAGPSGARHPRGRAERPAIPTGAWRAHRYGDESASPLTNGASDGDASDDDASPSDGDANPNDDGGANPSGGHVPTAPLEAGGVRLPHVLSRQDGHSDALLQLTTEDAAEPLAQLRQARSHRRRIQQQVSEIVGVPWRPSCVVSRVMRKEFRRRGLNSG